MIFNCSAAGDAESFVSQHVDCFAIGNAEGSVAVGIGDSVAEGFVQSMAEGFGGTFWVDFVGHHSSPLLHALPHFCKWGNTVPMSIFLWLVWAFVMVWGIAAILGCSSVLMVGAGVGTGVGGIGHSFLVLNRFSDAKHALAQGVPCLTGALGISSSGGGL